jgi:formate dehydrogenase-N alpha subunit
VLYALGWTHHSFAVQLIHAAAMVQLLMGNIGMPGGGVNAQRGHANIQGSTDMGAWNMLPGYLKIPRANLTTIEEYLKANTPKPLQAKSLNYWGNTPKFFKSLLKAYYGKKATEANQYGYDWLPKIDEKGDHSWGAFFDDMFHGKLEGLISFGMNPVANGPNTKKMLTALSKLKWLIVAENFETETAAFWKAKTLAAKDYPLALDEAGIATEVFLLPAANFAEKDGAFVNSSRWLQWKEAATDPPGEAKRDQEIIAKLFLEIRRLYEKDGGANPAPLMNMSWDYAKPAMPLLSEIAREVNGVDLKTLKQLNGFGELKDDGSTACGNWVYSGCWTEAGNQMARRGQVDPTGLGLYPQWSWSWPANRRILYNRASADENGQPWDKTRAPLQCDAEPGSLPAFIMLPEGVARLFAPDLVEGPFPEHYEPAESPVLNSLHPEASANPMLKTYSSEPVAFGKAKDFPYVAITYRLTEHFHYWTKHTSSSSELQSNFFVELPAELAAAKGIVSGDKVRVSSARGSLEGPALVTKRLRTLMVNGQKTYHVGLPIHWGFVGKITGPLINNLTPSAYDPNSGTPEYKGFLVNLEKI